MIVTSAELPSSSLEVIRDGEEFDSCKFSESASSEFVSSEFCESKTTEVFERDIIVDNELSPVDKTELWERN